MKTPNEIYSPSPCNLYHDVRWIAPWRTAKQKRSKRTIPLIKLHMPTLQGSTMETHCSWLQEIANICYCIHVNWIEKMPTRYVWTSFSCHCLMNALTWVPFPCNVKDFVFADTMPAQRHNDSTHQFLSWTKPRNFDSDGTLVKPSSNQIQSRQILLTGFERTVYNFFSFLWKHQTAEITEGASLISQIYRGYVHVLQTLPQGQSFP